MNNTKHLNRSSVFCDDCYGLQEVASVKSRSYVEGAPDARKIVGKLTCGHGTNFIGPLWWDGAFRKEAS